MVLSGSPDATMHKIGLFRGVSSSVRLRERDLREEYLLNLCSPSFRDYRLCLVRVMMSGECRHRDKGLFLSGALARFRT